ncbi:MAG: hypothetical protein ACFFA6_08085 [Promethearchaeota archaeon]
MVSRSNSYIHEFILLSVSIGFGIILGTVIFKAIREWTMKYRFEIGFCDLTYNSQDNYYAFNNRGIFTIFITLVLMFILLLSYLRLNGKYRKILILEFLLSFIISMIGIPLFFGGGGCADV